MKSVLISIHPKWCGLISSGEKTIEVRKTRPTITLPFTCYINMTQGGGVIGEFICDKVLQFTKVGFDGSHEPPRYMRRDRAGRVFDMPDDLRQMCLSKEQFEKYANGGYAYGWHISNLQIYDEPKELPRFLVPGECTECKRPCYWFTKGSLCGTGECDIEGSGLKPLTRPPQSWCYVEELK